MDQVALAADAHDYVKKRELTYESGVPEELDHFEATPSPVPKVLALKKLQSIHIPRYDHVKSPNEEVKRHPKISIKL
jgi:hypothetical protein